MISKFCIENMRFIIKWLINKKIINIVKRTKYTMYKEWEMTIVY